MHKTLIIIPTYNEAENISNLIDALFDVQEGVEILVVDDSTDHTSEIIKTKQQENSKLHLIKRTTKSGRGTAVLEGLMFGIENNYTYLVEMDADFSHDPKELPLLLKEAAENRVVIGSRYVRGSRIVNWPLTRRIFSRCANFYARVILGIGINDYTDGYRVYSLDAARKIDFKSIQSKGYIVLSEVAYQLYLKGVSFVEVPITFVNRSRGASNFSRKEIEEELFSVVGIKRQYGPRK